MKRCIVTIGREFCTGGEEIARRVAEELNVKLFDKELITLAAKKSGLSEEAIAASEKQHTHSLLYNMYTIGSDLPLSDQVFILESRIIKELAEEGPCVVLGRSGDYVLRERDNVLRVFLYANMDYRKKCAQTSESAMLRALPDKDLEANIRRADKKRSAYYNYYTQNRWGDSHNYDLALNAELGADICVKLILDAVRAKEQSL